MKGTNLMIIYQKEIHLFLRGNVFGLGEVDDFHHKS